MKPTALVRLISPGAAALAVWLGWAGAAIAGDRPVAPASLVGPPVAAPARAVPVAAASAAPVAPVVAAPVHAIPAPVAESAFPTAACTTCGTGRGLFHRRPCQTNMPQLAPGACFGYFPTQWSRWEDVCPIPFQTALVPPAPPVPPVVVPVPVPAPGGTGSDLPAPRPAPSSRGAAPAVSPPAYNPLPTTAR